MNTLLYKTPIILPGAIRERLVIVLNQQLADAIDLHLQLRQAQWNVSGPQFLSLHLFYDQITSKVGEAIGEIAGRVEKLGGLVLGTKRAVIEMSRLPECPLFISSSEQHMDALCRALASFVASVREAIRSTRDYQDFDSSDVLTQVWKTAKKLLGMVESYLQRSRTEIGETESSFTSAYEAEGEAA